MSTCPDNCCQRCWSNGDATPLAAADSYGLCDTCRDALLSDWRAGDPAPLRNAQYRVAEMEAQLATQRAAAELAYRNEQAALAEVTRLKQYIGERALARAGAA